MLSSYQPIFWLVIAVCLAFKVADRVRSQIRYTRVRREFEDTPLSRKRDMAAERKVS